MDEHIFAAEVDRVEVLVSRLKSEEHLLQKRITERNIASAFKQKRVAFKFDATTRRYYAFCMLWPTQDPKWFELGTLWVDEDSQGNGYAGDVFKRCADRLPKGAGVFLITREIEVLQIARGLGWQMERKTWTQSKFWRRIAEPWDRVRPGHHSDGVLMFLMP